MLARVPTLFNHCVKDSYDDLSGIKGAELYPGRALACSMPSDVVQLPPDLRDDLPVMRAHYGRIQLPHAADVVWELSHDVAKRYPEHLYSVFLFGSQAHGSRPNERRLQATANFNSKNWFIEMCKMRRLPILPTATYGKGEVPEQQFIGPWYVKGDVSASGIQVFRCESWQNVRGKSAALKAAFQVQQSAEVQGKVLAFLNVQYNLYHSRHVDFVTVTEQELNGFAHAGNSYPSRYDPRFLTDKAALYAADAGVEGLIAFDVVVVRSPQGEEMYFLLECNPRPNGSSYFTVVAMKLGIPCWLGLNDVQTSKTLAEIVRLLQRDHLELNPITKRGVAVVNWGTVRLGKVGLLFAGTPAEQRQFLKVVTRLIA